MRAGMLSQKDEPSHSHIVVAQRSTAEMGGQLATSTETLSR
jgi:predicted DNA-binding protein with PD1-like motif